MDDTIGITLLSGAFPPTFRFALADGREPAVTQVILSDARSHRPVWWIVSQRWAEALSFQPMWIEAGTNSDIQSVDAQGSDDIVDPIEDLPPSDPRHQAALQARLDPIEDLPAGDPRHQSALQRLRIDEIALRQPLAVVTYGVVPPGFRDVYPGNRKPPTLSAATSYVVFADGLINEGKTTFSLP